MNAATRVALMDLLDPTREDPLWEAEKSGWRCFVMGNDRCQYPPREQAPYGLAIRL